MELSKTTQFVAQCEGVASIRATRDLPPHPPQNSSSAPHQNHVQPLSFIGYSPQFQQDKTSFRPPTLTIIHRPKALLNLQLFWANLGFQGANELLTKFYNMVQQQILQAVKVTLLCLKKSLYNANIKGNRKQEPASQRSHISILKLVASHQDETIRSPSHWRSQRC